MAGVDGLDRNYQNILNGTTQTNTYNAVITSGKEESISLDDFFSMMVTQLTNQDFMNPMDDTQYMSQMAQFYSMQSMQQVAQYSQQNYAISLVGQNVTVSRYNVGGEVETVTGTVEKMSVTDGEYLIYVNGQSFKLSQIQQVENTRGNASSGTTEDKPEEKPADNPQTTPPTSV